MDVLAARLQCFPKGIDNTYLEKLQITHFALNRIDKLKI